MSTSCSVLLALVAATCTVSLVGVSEASQFDWGPRDYPLEEVSISVHWSFACMNAAFNIEEVSVNGDGTVEIIRAGGKRCAGDSRGVHRGSVRHLISDFYSSGFFLMNDYYPGRFWVTVTDDGIVVPGAVSDAFSCSTVIAFTVGDYSKTVESWGAAPAPFDDLARAVAQVALFAAPVTESEE